MASEYRRVNEMKKSFIEYQKFWFQKKCHKRIPIFSFQKAITFGYIVLLLFLYAIFSFAAVAAERNIGDQDRYRIAIPYFKMIGGNQRYNILARSLPEFFAVGLMSNERIDYISAGNFWRIATKAIPTDQLQRDRDLLFGEQFLNDLNIDLILKGSFLEYNGKIKIDATLKNRKNNLFVDISSNPVEVQKLLSSIQDIIAKLNAEINTIFEKEFGKKVAFLCFKDNSQPISIDNRWLEEDIAISIHSYINLGKGLVAIPWSKSRDYCQGR